MSKQKRASSLVDATVTSLLKTIPEKLNLEEAKIQYLRTPVHGEALRQFDMLSAEFEIITPLTLEAIFWYRVRTFSC